MTFRPLVARRYARFRWAAAFPAAAALLFAALAYEDVGVVSALPYFLVAVLSALYGVRPMYVLWVVPFGGFAAYAVVMLTAPLFGYGGGPLSEWLAFVALGVVTTVLLWLSRPRGEA